MHRRPALPPDARRWVRWLLGCMLAMALLPAASRLWAAQQGGDWVALCTAQGMRWVSLATGAPVETDLVPLDEPCPACLLQAQGLMPPPQAHPWRLPERFAEVPAAFQQAPRLLTVWRQAQSRGPPARA